MREIKFRAWDTKGNLMWYEVDLPHNKPEYLIYQQYTGSKDKNGKEVYEGDIVRHNDGFNIRICTVEWRHSGFAAYVKESALPWSILSEMIEVIGNIYENPELLERR